MLENGEFDRASKIVEEDREKGWTVKKWLSSTITRNWKLQNEKKKERGNGKVSG
jgi:hypothetical protein